MNEIEQLTAERDEALASAKRAWDEVGVVSHRRDDFRNRWTEGIRKRLADRLAVQPLVDAARAWRAARTAFGATRMEQEHDVLWAATEELEAAVDALTAGKVGTPDAHAAASTTPLTAWGADCICQKTGHDYSGIMVWELNPDADCPVHGEIDKSSVNAELADINARVASDKRVLDAVEAAVREIRPLTYVTSAARELVAAWDARRAPDSGDAEPDDLCAQCEHKAHFHQSDGCWYVTVSTGKDVGCPCSLARNAGEEPCGACNGSRWEDDQNWQPEQWELSRGRKPGAGRIPCGLCNLGGWNVPDGQEPDHV